MHNSNRQLNQVTLSGEILLESKYYVIGFVPADVVHLKREVWFSKLDSEQISSIERFLSEYAGMHAQSCACSVCSRYSLWVGDGVKRGNCASGACIKKEKGI